jgi:hypothetical protein
VAALDVEAAGGAGTGVQILLDAPERPIDAPLVDVMRHGPDRVRAIEPQRDATGSGLCRETRNVEELSRAVENGRQQGLLSPRITDLLAAVDAATAGPTSGRPCLKCG